MVDKPDPRPGTESPNDEKIVNISAEQLRQMTHGQLLDLGRSLGLDMGSCDTEGKALTKLVNNAWKIRTVYN